MIFKDLKQGEIYKLKVNNENKEMLAMICGINYIIENIIAEEDLLVINLHNGELHLLNYADIIKATKITERKGDK